MQIQSTIKIKKNYVTLLTSMRATEIFIKSKYISKGQPIMVIGAKSFKQLRTAGFNNVLYCAKDSNAMISFIEKKLIDIYRKKNYQGIEYCSGYQINQNFLRKLIQYNIPIKRTVLYKMNYKNSFNNITKNLIEKNMIKVCILYSQQNASKFLELIKKANLENQCKLIFFITLSKDISTILKVSGLDKVKNARQPNQDSLLNMLKKIDM